VSVVKLSVILIWEVVRQVKAGEHVTAYVLDAEGRVIAHSDDLNSFQHDFSSLPQVQAASVTGVITRDISGREVLIASAAVAGPAWRVFVEMPAEEAACAMKVKQASRRGDRKRRREFTAGLSGAVAWPLLVRAQ
jgi:hypothetical protein